MSIDRNVNNQNIKKTKPKRTWCYLQSPKVFEMAPCSCGNTNTSWSEYQGMLWCDKCKIDFVPEHNGLLDSPISFYTSQMFGLNFLRHNLLTGKIEYPILFNDKILYKEILSLNDINIFYKNQQKTSQLIAQKIDNSNHSCPSNQDLFKYTLYFNSGIDLYDKKEVLSPNTVKELNSVILLFNHTNFVGIQPVRNVNFGNDFSAIIHILENKRLVKFNLIFSNNNHTIILDNDLNKEFLNFIAEYFIKSNIQDISTKVISKNKI